MAVAFLALYPEHFCSSRMMTAANLMSQAQLVQESACELNSMHCVLNTTRKLVKKKIASLKHTPLENDKWPFFAWKIMQDLQTLFDNYGVFTNFRISGGLSVGVG